LLLAERQIRDYKSALDGLTRGALGERLVPRSVILNYRLLDPTPLKGDAKRLAFRMNSQMDLYYFSAVVLKRNKLSKDPDLRRNLHYQMCMLVMKDGLKEGIEIPRDHLKTTIYSECLPMWWALPFGARDEDYFTNIGYPDLYIEWLRRAHNQDVRILLVSETIKNATKLGGRIANHYENNDTFRELFFDILPTEKETWTADSLHQRRTSAGRGHGEGTFDFIGVGAALQSRHYNKCVQDDLVGREARKSQIVMNDTIDYHQVLVGATDSDPDDPGRDFDELVVGNRWSTDDLNSHVRKEEPYFTWTTHSALGGCCSLHPFGEPIYPEGFTKEKLLRWKRRLGTYHFSCQFQNYPIDPDRSKINMADFRYFHFEKTYGATALPKEPALPFGKITEISKLDGYRIVIRHHVAEGDVEKDVFPRYLERCIIIDPNHNGQHSAGDPGKGGRCRHALIVPGIQRDPFRIYILDQWAKAVRLDEFVKVLFQKALKWRIDKIHVETVAAQKFLKYILEKFIAENRREYPELGKIQIMDLKTPQTVGAKEERIDNFIPNIERHEVWYDVNNCAEIKEESEAWGQKKYLMDLLDVQGYIPQVMGSFSTASEPEVREFLEKQRKAYMRRLSSVA